MAGQSVAFPMALTAIVNGVSADPSPNMPIDQQSAGPRKGLEVLHLRKTYGDLVAVDDLSFHVEPGEILGLIGPNGAGKSTCMLMIIGLLRPDTGSITFDGQTYDPANPEMRSWLGIVPQELAIYPDLTAAQNLRFFGSLYGLSGSKLEERVKYVLELTGLERNADHTPNTFSGGMQRRLNFGVALLHEPRFVVLDEPTVGIDPQSRSNLLDCVRQLASHGVGVVYASHYMEEIEAVCNRVAIIDRGRLLRQGALDELLDGDEVVMSIKVGPLTADLVARLSKVATVDTDDGETNRILIQEMVQKDQGLRPRQMREALNMLEDAQVPVLGIETHETSLETLFLSLTGRKLRD